MASVKKLSLADTHPNLAAQAHGWDPSTVTFGSHKKTKWVCERKHVWEAQVHKRVIGQGCPICSNRQILQGFNDLSSTHPHIASEWHPSKNLMSSPSSVVAGSKKMFGGCAS